MKTQKRRTLNTILDTRDILVHTCCAHCLEQYFSILPELQKLTRVIYFDNSNIHPRTEYLARLKALQILVEHKQLKLIVADWSPQKWFEATEGWEKEGRAERCRRCWKFRLARTAKKARELGFKKFSTTMLASHYLNRQEIAKIGSDLARNLEFVNGVPLKKNFEIIKEKKAETPPYYKQNYCGCAYSLIERYEEKFTFRE